MNIPTYLDNLEKLRKVKSVIDHPGNKYFHTPVIKRLINLYFEKTGDLRGYNDLLERQNLLEKRLLAKGKTIIINESTRNHIPSSSR